jgi:hypothetical protein
MFSLQESQKSEIVLKDDDPDALLLVLQSAYSDKEGPIKIPEYGHLFPDSLTPASHDCVLQLRVLVVADKYAFASARKTAEDRTIFQIGAYIDLFDEFGEMKPWPNTNDFLSIIQELYELPAGLGEPVKERLFEKLIGNEVKELQRAEMCREMAKQQPEFAQDMFMRLMDRVTDTEALCMAEKVECEDCEAEVYKVMDEHDCV